jgi:hypothetical protein
VIAKYQQDWGPNHYVQFRLEDRSIYRIGDCPWVLLLGMARLQTRGFKPHNSFGMPQKAVHDASDSGLKK